MRSTHEVSLNSYVVVKFNGTEKMAMMKLNLNGKQWEAEEGTPMGVAGWWDKPSGGGVISG